MTVRPEELADGTRILVTWSGGNGPHEYVLRFDAWGTPYAETDFAHGGNVRHRLDDASTVRVAEALERASKLEGHR